MRSLTEKIKNKVIIKSVIYQNVPLKFLIENPFEYLQRYWITGNFYESGMLEFIRQRWIGKDSDLMFIDIGACIGNHTLFFSKVMGREGFSFEPDPDNYRLLNQNLIINNVIENVFHSNIAIGDKAGKAHLIPSDSKNNGLCSISAQGTIEVEIHSLDSLINDSFKIGLIKIDVEGYNMPVLAGAKETILRNRPELFIECASQDDLDCVDNFLLPLNYKRFERVFNATPTYFYYAD